ncbi:MAG TPA: cytochrome c [Bryobacteraceae bacterium]|jgi:mono/diheme cytochrome c family protein
MRTRASLLLRARIIALAVTALLEFPAPGLHAQPAQTANDRVYTDAQAARGRALYQEKCSTCHGEMLEGKSAPPLAGNAFLGVWGSQPLSELAGKIRNTMPADDPGKLRPAETADLVAYILQAGKFPSGSKELSADDSSLKSIGLAAAKPVASQAPPGNLNQLMRSILFPNSNIIFNVQTNDPGAPHKAEAEGTNAGFSWTTWGAGLYSGWQIVDYAAIALAESAPLLLTPGRRCQNGRPVPVDRPDWIKYTQEMAEVGREAYRIAQTRNQQAVSDFTEKLADTCFQCHRVYRDKRGFRQGDPAAAAARCTP